MLRRRTDQLGLLIGFLLGQLITGRLFGLTHGPIMSPDSHFFVGYADQFPTIDAAGWGYVGYVLLLRVGAMVGSAAWFAIVVQSAVVLLAGRALLSLGRRVRGELAGWAAAFIYLFHPLVAQWTRYVLTESLFYAGVILSTWCLVEAIDRRGLYWAPVWMVPVATASLRPNGVVLLGSAATLIMISRAPSWYSRILSVLAVWLCVALVVLTVPLFGSGGGGDQNGFGPRAWGGEVVWGVSEVAMDMPEPKNYDPSNRAYLSYAVDHPVDVARLAANRVWWELKQVRPWYSVELNLFIGVTMTLTYALSVLGAWVTRRSVFSLVAIVVTLPFVGTIGATWAIWEGRFGWWFLVVWTVWAGVGVQLVIESTNKWAVREMSEWRIARGRS